MPTDCECVDLRIDSQFRLRCFIILAKLNVLHNRRLWAHLEIYDVSYFLCVLRPNFPIQHPAPAALSHMTLNDTTDTRVLNTIQPENACWLTQCRKESSKRFNNLRNIFIIRSSIANYALIHILRVAVCESFINSRRNESVTKEYTTRVSKQSTPLKGSSPPPIANRYRPPVKEQHIRWSRNHDLRHSRNIPNFRDNEVKRIIKFIGTIARAYVSKVSLVTFGDRRLNRTCSCQTIECLAGMITGRSVGRRRRQQSG